MKERPWTSEFVLAKRNLSGVEVWFSVVETHSSCPRGLVLCVVETHSSSPRGLVLCVVETHSSCPSQVLLTVSKPGETADVPVGVIVGSAIGGLLLLALAVGLLWKVTICFQPWYFHAYGMQNCIQFHCWFNLSCLNCYWLFLCFSLASSRGSINSSRKKQGRRRTRTSKRRNHDWEPSEARTSSRLLR